MAKFKRHLPVSVTIAIVIHVIAVMLLVVGYQMKRTHTPSPEVTINTVKATVINTEKLAEEKKRREEEKKRKEIERQNQLAEQERIKQEKIKQEEEKKRLQAELEAEKKKAQEAEKRAEDERKRAEEAKKQAQLEKRKEQEKLAAEKAAEEERLAKILEQEEAELKAAELEAQRVAKAREMSKLIAQYQDALRSRIQSRWRKPLNDQPDAWCKVYVRQAPGGYVENVVVEQCSGDEAFRRSVEEAVWKSDPLPQPPSPELFDRDLRFKFIPET